MMHKRALREGWGRAKRAAMELVRPERAAELNAACRAENAHGALALGRGRSYGDAALNSDGLGILTERLDRLLSFRDGLLEAEAGVTLGQVMTCFLPRGWMAPVVPGTGAVSLGGAMACDVHGKNHETAGSFGRHVEWADLVLADGSQRRISRSQSSQLFAATMGGMGLTGVIRRLALRLYPVPSAVIALHEQRCRDLDQLMAALRHMSAASPYSVAWLDGMASGGGLGRGIVQAGDFAPAGTMCPAGSGKALAVPPLPLALARPVTVRAFNDLHFRRAPAKRDRVVASEAFFHPLDSLAHWNRLYGRQGFHQFQCVIPEPAAARDLPRLLELAQAKGLPPFLTVLKCMGPAGEGMLSFPMPGWTLAMDFAHGPGIETLLRQMAEIAVQAGGRLYLAKDSAMPPHLLAAQYPRLGEFRATLDAVDPAGRWQSDLARRLDVRGRA